MHFDKCMITCFVLIPFVISLQCDVKTKGKVKIAECKYIGLTEVPQLLPTDINVLDLSGNNIDKLYNNGFEPYRLLEELILKKNKIHYMEENSFLGLNRLNVLNIAENNLNLLHSYSSEIFLSLINLTKLDIRRNIQLFDTNVYHYPDNALAVLEELSSLQLDMASNPSFGKGFQRLKKLQSLTFERCYLKYLNKSVFENFSLEVQELNLIGCHLHFVYTNSDILHPFPKLTKLNLEGTCMHLQQALNILSPFTGKKFTLLDFSGLSCPIFNNNKYPYVLTITKRMMQYLKTICVESLYLSDNGIVDFEQNSLLSFERPECLKHIFFRGNRFAFSKGRQMDELKSFLQNSKNLKTFDYSYIPIRYPLMYNNLGQNFVDQKQQNKSSDVIIFPRTLETLLLNNLLCYDFQRVFLIPEGSNLKYLDISFGSSFSGLFFQKNSSYNLETLLLNGHFHLTLFQEDMIDSGKIKTLKWRDAKLYSVVCPADNRYSLMLQAFFKKLEYLEHLDMSKNSIWALPENLFSKMEYLLELHLPENLFRSIPRQIMDLKNIKLLDFRQNLLTTLDKNTRIWADSMNQKHSLGIVMADNPFECICDNLDFIEWINKTKVKLDSRSYQCRLLNGTLITVREAYERMHELFSHCRNAIWLTVAFTLLSTCFITVLLLFTYSKRWKICVFFYRKFRKIVEKKYCKSFIYDVFISYEGDSLNWITNCLIPKLENEWNLKICFKDRDFLPGDIYFDTEAESIENSKHVIFLLTPSFKSSKDYMFEVERVKHEKRMQNIENIIVLAKDITLKDIPTELAYIWNYVSFIQWPDNACDLDVAWQKLRRWICNELV